MSATSPSSARPYAEFQLGFVLGALPPGDAGARLDAMERALARLVRQWRRTDGISPARDLRMAPATLDRLAGWVEAGGALAPTVVERLATYHSGAVSDAAVPAGWIRVQLDAAHHGTRSQRPVRGR